MPGVGGELYLIMHWLLQSNLSTEEGQEPFVTALNAIQRSHGATWSWIKLVPFAGTIEPEADYGPRVFPLGSTSILQASQRYGWNPGVLFNPVTFRFEEWATQWGIGSMINHDAEITTFGAVRPCGRVFIRPCEDLKAFTGLVIEADELEQWQRRVADATQSSLDSSLLTPNTQVVVAPVKEITREWRTFVVGGRVVAASQYAELGKRLRDGNVPSEIIAYAQRAVDKWQPADCFVLDVGEVGGRVGIVEVNTLNSSGVYESNVTATFTAIEEFYA